MRKEMNKINTVLILLFVCFSSFAQEVDEKEKQKSLQSSTNLTWDANKALSEDDFIAAEVDYRKAISKSSDNSAPSSAQLTRCTRSTPLRQAW